MSLLTIVQAVSLRVLSQKPTVAAASIDPKIQQIIELVNNDGQELAARYSWQVLRNEATFSTTAVESQGDIRAITGADFNFIVNESMWNRSQRRPIPGPLSPAEWQLLKAQFSAGPWLQYTTRGNQLLFFPVPSAGQSVFFEWVSKNWCASATGAGPANWPTPFQQLISTTSGTLSYAFSAPAGAPLLSVIVNGVEFYNTVDYTLTTTGLTFVNDPGTGTNNVLLKFLVGTAQTFSAGTGATSMTNDTDTSNLDERLHVLGALWRFKKENHLEYEEDYESYEKAVADAISRDGSKMRRSLGAETREFFPSIVIPSGNWGH